MKAFTLAIVAGLSIAVSMMLWMSMPNVDEPDPTVQSKPDTESVGPTVQPNTEPKPPRSDTRLYTVDHWLEHPELYNYGEAWNIWRVVYNEERASCYDEFEDDIITLNECVTLLSSWWLELEDILERTYT